MVPSRRTFTNNFNHIHGNQCKEVSRWPCKNNISSVYFSDIRNFLGISCWIYDWLIWPMGYCVLWLCSYNCTQQHLICMWNVELKKLIWISLTITFTFLGFLLLWKSTTSSVYKWQGERILEIENRQLFGGRKKKFATNTMESNSHKHSSYRIVCVFSKHQNYTT